MCTLLHKELFKKYMEADRELMLACRCLLVKVCTQVTPAELAWEEYQTEHSKELEEKLLACLGKLETP